MVPKRERIDVAIFYPQEKEAMDKTTLVLRRRRPKHRTAEDHARSTNQYSSKTLARALDVLECFRHEHVKLSLKEISGQLGCSESALYRILVTLEFRGYLVQESNGAYRISPRLLHGKARENTARLQEVAKPHLEMLAARFNETASLACLFEDRIQVVDTVETLHSMRSTNRPGRLLPPHCSSMGKAITAFQSPEKINRLLEVYGLIRRTSNTITDRVALSAELARIREQGYAVDREEATEGSFCIGAPVRCQRNPVVASVSLSMPILRFTAELEEPIEAAVVATASAIASEID